MSIYILSFLAGILTILAPCVLPILPVILSGSLSKKQRWEPYVIIVSCLLSIVLFTLLLKVFTTFIVIESYVWTTISGILILLYGLSLIFPDQWTSLMQLFQIKQKSSTSREAGGFLKDILLGASLGPIFTTCSPTYALILSVVFPASLLGGIFATIVYAMGFGLMLLLIVWFGRKFTKHIKDIANPNSRFKKILGIILIVLAFLIITGSIKKIESWVVEHGWYGALSFEQSLVDNFSQ